MNRKIGLLWSYCRLAPMFLALVILASCSRNPMTITSSWPAVPPAPKLVVTPGDVLDVKFRFNPELNESQTVRPDGKISLQIVDEVEVAGLSPSEVDKKLSDLYKGELVQPVLTVVMRTIHGQRVFVGGEVNKPGVIALNGPETALEAVMEAGGFNYLGGAKPQCVVVIRHANGKRYARMVDLKSPLISAESEPFYLAAGDIVFVPRTTITKVDQWVDQYINKIIPDIARDALIYYALSNNNNNDNNN